MKICHISTEKGFRGGERQLVRVHEGVILGGDESVILYRKGNDSFSEYENSHSADFDGIRALFAPYILHSVLKKLKPDLIHCHDSRALTLAAVLKPMLRVPVVFSRKTVFPIRNSGSTERKYRAADHIIAVSNASAEEILRRFPEIPVTVIHDGVVQSAGRSRESVRREFGVGDDEFLYASVGYFSKEKNLPLLISAADLLAKSNPSAKLLLIGPVEEQMREQIAAHPSIISAGRVDCAEQYYSGFDAYLSASTQEGLGSALLDAVVRDIPAAALFSGGSADIFPENDPFHCFSESHFLIQAAVLCRGGNSLLVKERGESARRRFSVDQLQENHRLLYRQLAGKNAE